MGIRSRDKSKRRIRTNIVDTRTFSALVMLFAPQDFLRSYFATISKLLGARLTWTNSDGEMGLYYMYYYYYC